jgi:serine/threonine protein kinase
MNYEFVVENPPFTAAQRRKHCPESPPVSFGLRRTQMISPECADIIRRLLDVNPAPRLGSKGSHVVVRHIWFEGLDPTPLEPPFLLETSEVEETSHFESRHEFKPGVAAGITMDITLARPEVLRGKTASTPGGMTALSSFQVAQRKGKNKANEGVARESHPRPRVSPDNRGVISQSTSLNLGLLRGKRRAPLRS